MIRDRMAAELVRQAGQRGDAPTDLPWTPAILEAAVRLLLWTVEDYQQRSEQVRA